MLRLIFIFFFYLFHCVIITFKLTLKFSWENVCMLFEDVEPLDIPYVGILC